MSRKFGVNHISGVKCLGGHKKDKAGKKAFEFGPYQRTDLGVNIECRLSIYQTKVEIASEKLTNTFKCYLTCYHPILWLGHRDLRKLICPRPCSQQGPEIRYGSSFSDSNSHTTSILLLFFCCHS